MTTEEFEKIGPCNRLIDQDGLLIKTGKGRGSKWTVVRGKFHRYNEAMRFWYAIFGSRITTVIGW